MASGSDAARNRAAEARTRKRDEVAALDGLVAVINSQEAQDQDFVFAEMKKKPLIAGILAGMIRDGRIDQARQRAQEASSASPPSEDLGRAIGKGTKTFRKLGISALVVFLNKIAGDNAQAKAALLFSTKTLAGGAAGPSTISQETVGEIWHLALDVDDTTPLPTAFPNSRFLKALIDVLAKRYEDCGSRLERYKTIQQSTKVAFWHFDPTSENANEVLFVLGNTSLKLTLPFDVATVKEIRDWVIDAPHTFCATLAPASKFLSVPLGEKLEGTFPAECAQLPMKEPSQRFEYRMEAGGAVNADMAGTPSPGTLAPLSPGSSSMSLAVPPLVSAEALANLPA